jgi:hypothetical protein
VENRSDLTLPFFSVLAASSLKIYPFGNRLICSWCLSFICFWQKGSSEFASSLIKTNS